MKNTISGKVYLSFGVIFTVSLVAYGMLMSNVSGVQESQQLLFGQYSPVVTSLNNIKQLSAKSQAVIQSGSVEDVEGFYKQHTANWVKIDNDLNRVMEAKVIFDGGMTESLTKAKLGMADVKRYQDKVFKMSGGQSSVQPEGEFETAIKNILKSVDDMMLAANKSVIRSSSTKRIMAFYIFLFTNTFDIHMNYVNLNSGGGAEHANQIKELWVKQLESSDEIKDLMSMTATPAERKIWKEEYAPARDAMQVIIDNIAGAPASSASSSGNENPVQQAAAQLNLALLVFDEVDVELQSLMQAAQEQGNRSLNGLSTTVAVLLMAIATISLLFMFVVTGSVKKFIQAASKLTVGQTDAAEQDSMALSSVGQVSEDIVSAVVDDSIQIDKTHKLVARSMDDLNSQLAMVMTSVSEMASSIQEVAEQSATAATDATSAGDTAKEGGVIVEKTIADINSISDAVRATAVSVETLGERGNEIGKIIDVIKSIADQTNLLALNAAIEAARAGEQGRGFAVVADEVRELAKRTTDATEEVSGSIRDIQEETGKAVKLMETGVKQIEEGGGRAKLAGEALNDIVESTQKVELIIQSIAAAAEQQSATSSSITESVDSIARVASEAGGNMSEAVELSHKLSETVRKLKAAQ